MMNREQVIRDLSAALSHAEENGVMEELALHPYITTNLIAAVDKLALPLYKSAGFEPLPDYMRNRGVMSPEQFTLFRDTSNRISDQELEEFKRELDEITHVTVVDKDGNEVEVPLHQGEKVELDEFHKHEVLDRACTMFEMLDHLLEDHPAVKQNERLRALYEGASQALWRLYTAAAQEYEK